jgi:glycosyltransferase involved in cell wall biosynthesis
LNSLGADSSANGREPLVTIAVPTYNRAATFLPRAIAAARAQKYGNLEILVSDNASSDDTRGFVGSLADARIRYHRHAQNLGAAGNLNFCISDARGEYLLLLMDDDSIDDDFVEACMHAARTNPLAGMIRTGTRVIDGNAVVLYESPNMVVGLGFTDFVLGWLEGKTAPYLCSTLFRTAPLQEIGMRSRHNLWSDLISELPLAARLGRVDIPDVKATFCIHGAELTVNAAIEQWIEDSQQLLELACSLAPQDEQRLRERFVPFLAMFNYRNALRLAKPWPARLAACLTVGRSFGPPPEKADLVRELLRRVPWYEKLRNFKRSIAAGPAH